MKRLLAVLMLVVLAGPAWAEGLTPAVRIISECLAAKRFSAYAPASSAAITAACGSTSAIDTTIAGGNASLLALIVLRKAAVTAWKNRYTTGGF